MILSSNAASRITASASESHVEITSGAALANASETSVAVSGDRGAIQLVQGAPARHARVSRQKRIR